MTEISFPSGTIVFLSDVKFLNPAVDTQDDTLILAVPLPGIRVVQTRHGEEQCPDMVLCVLASKKFNPDTKRFEDGAELFECTEEEFSKRGWLPRIPVTQLKQRWEASKILEFTEGKVPNINPFDVYWMVKAKWLYYMDFYKNLGADVFCTLWVIGTYFHFLFHYYPYLKWGGDLGVGKSKAGVVADGMCFNSEIFSGASESSIFRLASDTRGTQIIDEQEHLADEQVNAYVQVLNSGFQASGAAIRTNKETMRVERWSAYSPKMICSIMGLRETLQDRSIEIILYKSANQEIKNREPPRWEANEWKHIRHYLYLLLFQKWQEVRDIYNSLENVYGFSGRFWNITKPIIAIAKFIDIYAPKDRKTVEAELISFLQDVLKAKQANARCTNSARVVFALKHVLDDIDAKESRPDDYKRRVAISEVIEAGVREEGEWFKEEFKPKNVATILKNLHLYSNPKRRKGGFTFEVSMQDVEETIALYDFDELGEHDERGERKNETGVDGKIGNGSFETTCAEKKEENRPSEICSPHTPNTPSSPEGTCELCGRYGSLTRSNDGYFVCLGCLKESDTQLPAAEGVRERQRKTLCPPWLTTAEWDKLDHKERFVAWANIPRKEE